MSKGRRTCSRRCLSLVQGFYDLPPAPPRSTADTPGPIPETSPVAPRDVYGKTKATGERLVAEFETQAGTRCVVARLFNVIGEAAQRIPTSYPSS